MASRVNRRAARELFNTGRTILRAALGVLLAATAATAAAQYPDKPIRMVVPQAPGSATDTLARFVSAELPKHLGQPVVVDNRPGGALTLGIDIVAKSPPDGYTIGVAPVGSLAISRHMVAKLPYDIDRDLAPVIQISSGQMLLAVAPSLPVNSVKELIALAGKSPQPLLNASSSNGSPGHVAGEYFKLLANVKMTHVPYKGGAQAINDLIAGHVQVMFESLQSITAFAKTNKVKPLAVTGPRRSAALPDVPTLKEAGLPDYEATTWTGIIVPAATPRPIVDRLNAALNATLASQAYRDRFAVTGDEVTGGTPEQFAATIKRESARWLDVIKRSGATLD